MADEDALPGGEPVGLDDARRPRDGQLLGGRDAGGPHHVLGEGLRALDPRRVGARAEDGNPAAAQHVGHAGDERPFRPDHDQVGADRPGKPEQAFGVFGAHGVAPSEARDAGVPRRGVELCEAGALGELPRERVLAGTRADDEDVHRASLRSAFDGDTWTMAAPPHSTARVEVVRIPAGPTSDVVAVEEPLEIRIGGAPVAVTMRTPGHDEELALGFALSEGLTPAGARLPDDLAANTVELDAPGFDPARLARSFYTSSSCGVCGKGALEAVAVEAPRVESDAAHARPRS